MIVCPNCNHPNPDGAVQCEACYTPLPEMTACPNCGATVQADASFCGQCGTNLQAAPAAASSPSTGTDTGADAGDDIASFNQSASQEAAVPDLVSPDPLVEPEPLSAPVPEPTAPVESELPDAGMAEPAASQSESPPSPAPAATGGATQLQQQTARLLHIQTNTIIELSPNLSLIHMGKPNDRIPPDVDVSGFPNSEIVSRVHADIRVEGDVYYIEDVGSSNGTYINNLPLPLGNRHRLRPGDRISLGKGDKVSFIFQLS
jgi:pSer/pThr/pTyr-binding forkhead associated (FHA) protein